MLCGTKGFKKVDSDPWTARSPKTPKKKASKNPYSNTGLDKFSTLLTEMEARRAKIMADAGAQGIVMVRFTYSNSNDWVPIIVKLPSDVKKPKPLPPPLVEASPPTKDVGEGAEEKKSKESFSCCVKETKECCSWKSWRHSCYWPLVMVLILLCLVMFGRAFAVCCSTIWWYMAPVVMQGKSSTRVRKYYKGFWVETE